MGRVDSTEVAITFLQSCLDPSHPQPERLVELFGQKCPQYFSLTGSETRREFITENLPNLLRAVIASTIFQVGALHLDDLPFDSSPLPHTTDLDNLSEGDRNIAVFLMGVCQSWTDSINKDKLYALVGQHFQKILDPMKANYQYGVFFDTPTLEHAHYLVDHPEAIAYIRQGGKPRYHSNLVWDTYIDRFPKDTKRPERDPDTKKLLEHLDSIQLMAEPQAIRDAKQIATEIGLA